MTTYFVRASGVPVFSALLISGLFLLPLSLSVAAQELATTPAALAARLLNQIQNAQHTIEKECGSSVLKDGTAEVFCKGHGKETIVDAWNRYLVQSGIPEKYPDREALARAIGLDSRASLVLAAPLARIDGIDYLLSQLRRVAGS